MNSVKHPSGLRPDPAFKSPTASFSLPDASPAPLELPDVAGRRILVRDVGALGPWTHVLNLAEGGTFAAGVYLLRLTQGSRGLMARATIMR